MKTIRMTKTAPGSEEQSGVTKDYEAGTEHTVSDSLAQAFKSMGACEVLGDPEQDEQDELLGVAKKAAPKSRLRNK